VTQETLHLIVKGRVQGVGFRWYVVDEARRLGLAGWVRNNRDGSVELCAGGAPEALRSLESHVRKGPTGSRVSDVEHVEDGRTRDLQAPFSIARD
jgi:acylphosphatase